MFENKLIQKILSNKNLIFFGAQNFVLHLSRELEGIGGTFSPLLREVAVVYGLPLHHSRHSQILRSEMRHFLTKN